jgi:regulatory protein
MATETRRSRERKLPQPLDSRRLEELALAYVARFAVPAAKLRDYLKRKLRERGWDGEGDPPVAGIVARFIAAGYVDDQAWAGMKSASLLRRGFGNRRVDQALGAAGIGEDMRRTLRASESEARESALRLARRRGFGPFGQSLPDRPKREKQLAAMLRAGHRLDTARELVEATDATTAEDWVRAASGEEE